MIRVLACTAYSLLVWISPQLLAAAPPHAAVPGVQQFADCGVRVPAESRAVRMDPAWPCPSHAALSVTAIEET